MFLVLKTDYFQMWFLYIVVTFLLQEKSSFCQKKRLLKLEKRQELTYLLLKNSLKGAVVNRGLSSLHRGSHTTLTAITLTVPLISIMIAHN